MAVFRSVTPLCGRYLRLALRTHRAVESTVAILVAAAPLVRPTADLLKAAITGWLQRDRRTVLRATVGDSMVELTGDPTPDQQRVLDALLRIPSAPDRAAQE